MPLSKSLALAWSRGRRFRGGHFSGGCSSGVCSRGRHSFGGFCCKVSQPSPVSNECETGCHSRQGHHNNMIYLHCHRSLINIITCSTPKPSEPSFQLQQSPFVLCLIWGKHVRKTDAAFHGLPNTTGLTQVNANNLQDQTPNSRSLDLNANHPTT